MENPPHDVPLPEEVSPVKEWLSFFNAVTNQAAAFIDCGKPDGDSINKELQERQLSQANHLRDLVEHCPDEDLKLGLFAINMAFDMLKDNSFDSTAMDNLKHVLTDGELVRDVHNFGALFEAMSPMNMSDTKAIGDWLNEQSNRLIPSDKLLRQMYYVEVTDSG